MIFVYLQPNLNQHLSGLTAALSRGLLPLRGAAAIESRYRLREPLGFAGQARDEGRLKAAMRGLVHIAHFRKPLLPTACTPRPHQCPPPSLSTQG